MAPVDQGESPDVIAKAIELFARHGYELTTVGELADATGMSRSTFFRRFGSKEDIVFADHDFLLQRVETELREHAGDPLDAVCDGARMVLEHHLKRPEISRFRYELLQENPVLRDRELVTSSRYERAFSSYLRTALPQPLDRNWILVAFAAAVVSMHNLALRSWLRRIVENPVPLLASEFTELSTVFRELLGGPGADRRIAPRVVVAIIDEGNSASEVLTSIARSLAE